MTLIISQDNTDFAAYLAETEPQVKVMPAKSWQDGLLASLKTDGHMMGAKLPWAKTHSDIAFRGGEVTLWQGINGHGKSQMLGQVILGFAAQGEKSCIASFEMRPVATLRRLLRQVAQNVEAAARTGHTQVQLIAGAIGAIDALAAVIRYCSEKLRIQHIVVDSLMKCVRGTDDYNGQKDFVDLLTSLARDYNIHIHLVHHAKKQQDENSPPGKFSASGSHAITDLVDQVLTVWRNKRKEREIEQALREGRNVDDKTAIASDALLICDKNRHGEWEGSISLWYHAASLQYTTDSRCLPIDFMGH